MNVLLTVVLILLAVVLILAGVCIFVKLRLKIRVYKEPVMKTTLEASLETMGGLIKKYLSSSGLPKAKKKKSKAHTQTSATQNDQSTKQKVSSYYSTFCRIKRVFMLSKHKVRKNILVEKLRLKVDFGLDDAAHTGIATGAVWAGIYNAVAFVSHIARLNEPEITVNPDFENEKLAFDGECIIVLRLANIINILIITGFNYFTQKNKEKAAINNVYTD